MPDTSSSFFSTPADDLIAEFEANQSSRPLMPMEELEQDERRSRQSSSAVTRQTGVAGEYLATEEFSGGTWNIPARGTPAIDYQARIGEWEHSGINRVNALTNIFGQDALVLGHLVFDVPPLAIRIKKGFLTYKWKSLRTNDSIPMKSGHGECYIEIDLVFSSIQRINTLREVIALYNKMPFCFIENAHIRNIMIPDRYSDSMAVCLESLVIDAVAGYPDSLFATLITRWFNYKPYSMNFWFRRTWQGPNPADQSASRTTNIEASQVSRPLTPMEELEQSEVPTSEPIESPSAAPSTEGASIVDLSSLERIETLNVSYPPEARLTSLRQGTDPADPLLEVTYPVVYPFNSIPFMERVAVGLAQGTSEIRTWTDHLTFSWRTFKRYNLPRSWAYTNTEQPVVVHPGGGGTSPSRTSAPPISGDRNIILIVGDSITVGYLSSANPTNIYPPVRYTGTRFGAIQGFEIWSMAKESATTGTSPTNNSMKGNLDRALSEFVLTEGISNGSRLGEKVAAVVINGGLNDGGTGTTANFDYMARKVVATGALALLVTPTPFKDSTLPSSVEDSLVLSCEGIMELGNRTQSDRIVSVNSHIEMSASPPEFTGIMKDGYRNGSSPNINVHPTATGNRALARYIRGELIRALTGVQPDNAEWTITEITDGDTLTVRKLDETLTIRIMFIDTPERGASAGPGHIGPGQGYAETAYQRLITHSGGGDNTVTLTQYGEDVYGRTLAEVFRGEVNCGLELVREGFAYATAPTERRPNEFLPYLQAQEFARNARANIWGQGSTEMLPRDYRSTYPFGDEEDTGRFVYTHLQDVANQSTDPADR